MFTSIKWYICITPEGKLFVRFIDNKNRSYDLVPDPERMKVCPEALHIYYYGFCFRCLYVAFRYERVTPPTLEELADGGIILREPMSILAFFYELRCKVTEVGKQFDIAPLLEKYAELKPRLNIDWKKAIKDF